MPRSIHGIRTYCMSQTSSTTLLLTTRTGGALARAQAGDGQDKWGYTDSDFLTFYSSVKAFRIYPPFTVQIEMHTCLQVPYSSPRLLP